jgi:hypothetical protein
VDNYLTGLLKRIDVEGMPAVHQEQIQLLQNAAHDLEIDGTLSQLNTVQPIVRAIMSAFVSMDGSNVRSFGHVLVQLDKQLTGARQAIVQQVQDDTACSEIMCA